MKNPARENILPICILVLTLGAAPPATQADAFIDVSPTMIDLNLGPGEMITVPVSLTIHPIAIRPYTVDVVPSDPAALLEKLTGILINGAGGDTSLFDVKFTGGIGSLEYDLNFVDVDSGSILGSIPVTVVPLPAPFALFAACIALVGRIVHPHS